MQQQLARVDVARKEFIATASHELRTPIFSLGGFVELLQDEDLDEETRREFLDTMSEQVARLQKLSVDLLDLSRLDSGSVELHTEPVDLAELTRSVAGEFHPRLAEHHTELELDVPDEGPSASCDRERVAQIMRILLDNALRHTPDGHRRDRERDPLQRRRRAHGGGLRARPAGRRARARSSSASTPATRLAAPGLGLAIARELAERMDGRLVLDDRAGQHRLHARAAGGRRRRVRRAAVGGRRGSARLGGRLRLERRRGRHGAARRAQRGHDHARPGGGGARPRGRLRPGRDLRPALARRRDDHLALRRRHEPAGGRRRGRPGLGLRDRRRGLHRDQRARRHHGPRRHDGARRAGLRRVLGRQPRAGEDRRPRPERRRRAAEGRAGGPVAHAARARRVAPIAVGEPVAAIGSPFGERQSLSIGRDLGARPRRSSRSRSSRSATRSRPTPPSTRATPAGRCSTRRGA